MPLRCICHTTLVVIALAAGSPALAVAADATSPEADQRATEQFRKGQARFDARDFAGALPLFQSAWQLSRSPNARLYVARCLSELGRNVQAYTELSGVIVDTTATNEVRYERTLEAAQAELAEANLRVAKLVILADASATGSSVLLDDAPVPPAQLGVPIILEPGEHRLLARASGSRDFSRVTQLVAGQSHSIQLTFTPAIASVESPAAAPQPQHSDGTLGTWRTAGLLTAGAGVVALGVFATTGLLAKGKYDSVSDACGGKACPDDSHADDIDSGRSLQTVANVSLVIGGLALAAGGSMFLFGPRPAQPRAAVLLVPGGGFATYRARF